MPKPSKGDIDPPGKVRCCAGSPFVVGKERGSVSKSFTNLLPFLHRLMMHSHAVLPVYTTNKPPGAEKFPLLGCPQ